MLAKTLLEANSIYIYLNPLIYLLCTNITVCNAGFYKKGGSCVLCPENKIKSSPGNATECDSVCDEEFSIANDEHTECGKTFIDWQTSRLDWKTFHTVYSNLVLFLITIWKHVIYVSQILKRLESLVN